MINCHTWEVSSISGRVHIGHGKYGATGTGDPTRNCCSDISTSPGVAGNSARSCGCDGNPGEAGNLARNSHTSSISSSRSRFASRIHSVVSIVSVQSSSGRVKGIHFIDDLAPERCQECPAVSGK